MSSLTTKTDFPEISREDWVALVENGLRGASKDSLKKKTEDGISRGPLARAADLPSNFGSLTRSDIPLLEGRSWHITAPVRDPDLSHANTQLLEDLKGGCSAIRFENSLDFSYRNTLKRLLEGVYTDLVPIQFSHGTLSLNEFKNVESFERLKTSVLWSGLDPFEENAEVLASLLDSMPETWRILGLAPVYIHESGGTDVQELMVLAASLVAAMRVHGADNVCKHIVIELAADRDMHLTIAKFRAARRIVSRIAEAFHVDGRTIPLCAVTSLRMMQREDAWTNLLRVMSAGTGAVIGGANMVTTRPFTDRVGLATPFAHRIARNMQHMMMEESHLGQVSDAAYGSYWHEKMTDKLAHRAWRSFQAIEAQGGWLTYKNSGRFEADLIKSKTEREAQNAAILGVTLHPAKGVKAPEVRS